MFKVRNMGGSEDSLMLRAKGLVLCPRLTSTDVKKRILLLKRQHAENSGVPKGGAGLTIPARPGPRPGHVPKHAIPNSQGGKAHPKGHALVDVPTWTTARPRPAVAAVPGASAPAPTYHRRPFRSGRAENSLPPTSCPTVSVPPAPVQFRVRLKLSRSVTWAADFTA